MSELYMASGHKDEACSLVRRYHYSHKESANIQYVLTWHREGGLFGDLGKAIAACIFTIPPARWSEPVWELARLVRIDDCDINLTGLIAQACKNIKGMIDLVVSYADWTQKHHGGIYQAASWRFNGIRDKKMDGIYINGIYTACRTCNHMYGTHSLKKLSLILSDTKIEPHFDEGKYLYWRALSKSGKKKATRLGLQSLPYPKPGAYK